MKKTIRLLSLLALCVSGAAFAQGEAYPARPVTMVIPFPPGSISDVIGRAVAERLSKGLGQSVIADNRPGANGGVAASYVVRTKPDGYTFMMASNGIITLNKLLIPNIPYDPADLAPLALGAEVPAVLVVRKTLPVNDLRGLIDLAKRDTGITCASGSATAQVACETLKNVTGSNIVTVPYKGEPLGLTDVVAGQVDAMVLNLPVAVPQIRSANVKALALVGARKVDTMPEIPLARDTLPDYVMPNGWTGFFAAAAVPAPIRERLSKELIAALTAPEIKERVEATPGTVLSAETPTELAGRIASENEIWARLIKEAKVQIQ
ncbi:MAG: Bug family tripartite tricarboxylate transporter substrate binding protein [Lautropia sp.]